MDESWRMRMGMPTPKLSNYPPRRSTDYTASHLRKPISDDPLNPEDFTDVFGGAPRTILSRQFSTNFPRSSSSTGFFYEDIFRQPDKAAPAVGRSGRNLPQFRIPLEKQRSCDRDQRSGFYSDIFGWDDERMLRSRSRSKTSSSSALSSEELSPLRPAISDDGYDDVSLFASKLRPINVRSRWNSTRMGHDDYQRQQKLPPFAGRQPIYNSEDDFLDNLRNYPFRLSRRNASPESMSLEPISNSSFRVSADDLQFNSPSSAVSSVCQSDSEIKTCEIVDEILGQDAAEQEEDESMSSYVIEINSDNREWICESNGVDEAIAWAKEKFQTHCSEEKPTVGSKLVNGLQLSEGHTDSFQSVDEQQEEWAAEEETSKIQVEMQLLDEKIRLWSTGKEADIRLLLSSLHHILWPNSGWLAIPLMNIIESSQVKKVYQKAQLCLHPDKLQQRGATFPEKHIAEKVFSALQDAWDAFISHETCLLPLKNC
ncbi:hypothetical protein Pfo_023509 [Paulownia fortunei]|nr:hypothetical protein Pfo_023509 [Paulownia fortunei]